MATSKQIDFLRSLYEELGQEPEDDIEELDTREASARIKELLAMKKEK
jgi:hypothetical protein